VLVLAGDNQKKIEYIKGGIEAGLHVFSDKPMCINAEGYALLKEAFQTAGQKKLLLYDIMTERYEITTILQKELSHNLTVFGAFRAGSPDDPSVTKESVHHLFKYVSGQPLRRPAWYLDVKQQGEGIVDVATHLVDLVMWEIFPARKIDYKDDIEMVRARRWPTMVTREQFQKVTGAPDFPDYLKPQLNSEGILPYYCNGEMIFKVRGIHAKVSVIWNFEAPEGGGDTHYSVMKGTRSNIVIRQGKEQNYRPELYIEPAPEVDEQAFGDAVKKTIDGLAHVYPGLEVAKEGRNWHVLIPDKYRVGHEAHFAQVAQKFLGYVSRGRLPEWEVPNMIAKYYVTTKALEMAETEGPQTD